MASQIIETPGNLSNMSPYRFRHFLNEDGSIDTVSLFSLTLLVSADAGGDLHSLLLGQTEEVITAASIQEARSLLEVNLAELLVLAPDKEDTGLHEFLREMKALRPDLPILLITPNESWRVLPLIHLGAWDFASLSSASVNDALQRLGGRKLAEMQKIQAQVERSAFWSAVHNAPDGLGIIGNTGMVLFANQKFRDFCSALVETDPGPNPSLPALLRNHNPSATAQLEEQLKEHSAHVGWQTEVKIEDRYFRLFLSSVTFGELGELTPLSESVRIAAPRLYVLWIRDITERKEQDKFQRDMLTTTTHDLKGPLGAILGGVSLMKNFQANKPEINEKLVVSIGASARTCMSLIDDLLSAHKMEAGSFLIKPAWHDLQDILEGVVRDYGNTAEMREITFTSPLLSDCPQIYADYLGLHRVLSNLVSNAIKFTKNGGAVEVAAAKAGDEVRISVRDSGEGIDPAEQSGLFEKYTRLRKHSNVTGSGLGLYIVKAIVAAHGGRIELESRPGIGSTFTVCFPDP